MKKHKELNIKFYKTINPSGNTVNVLDTSNAAENNKSLQSLVLLDNVLIKNIIETIVLIQNKQPYNPYFLDSDEEYTIFGIRFVYPFFWVENSPSLHMDDFKLLLEEWLTFKNK